MAHQSAYQSRRVGAIRLDEVALDGQPSATRGVAMSAGDVPIADEETFYVELICRFWRVSEYLNFHRAALDVRAARDVLQVREPATVLNNLQLLALTLKSHWKPVAAELGENASEIRSRVQETLLYFLRRFNLMNDMLASAYDSLPDAQRCPAPGSVLVLCIPQRQELQRFNNILRSSDHIEHVKYGFTPLLVGH